MKKIAFMCCSLFVILCGSVSAQTVGEAREFLFSGRGNMMKKLDMIGIAASHEDEALVDVLIHVAKNEHDIVRNSAVERLGSLGDPRAVEPLIEILQGKHKRNIFAATGRFLNDHLNPITLAMNVFGEPVGDREGVAHALGEIGDPRAIDALVKATKDGNERIRSEAVAALGKIDDPRVFSIIEELADSKDIILSISADEILNDLKRERLKKGERK